MNVQCELVPPPLCGQLNHFLVISDTVTCSMGNLMTLVGLGYLFVGVVHCHHHCLHCSAAAPAAASPAANLFGPPAEFSCLVLALEGILDILCYQVC